jgi:hypothetical protein
VTVLLGGVMKVASSIYGYIYGQMGFLLISIAGVLWAGGLIWAIVDYFHHRDKSMLIFIWFSWISLLAAIALLFQPAGFWAL